jgi:hypothetical protein
MSKQADTLRQWREAVLLAADHLETACWPLLTPRSAPRGVPDSLSYREGAASWVPHVEAVLDLVHNLRHVAGDSGLEHMIDRADREVA